MAENGNENPKRVSRDTSLDLKAWGLGVIGAAIGGVVFSAVAAGVLMLFCEWHHRPWVDDGSLSYFLTHVMDLTLATKLMFALGVALAFFLGKGR